MRPGLLRAGSMTPSALNCWLSVREAFLPPYPSPKDPLYIYIYQTENKYTSLLNTLFSYFALLTAPELGRAVRAACSEAVGSFHYRKSLPLHGQMKYSNEAMIP